MGIAGNILNTIIELFLITFGSQLTIHRKNKKIQKWNALEYETFKKALFV